MTVMYIITLKSSKTFEEAVANALQSGCGPMMFTNPKRPTNEMPMLIARSKLELYHVKKVEISEPLLCKADFKRED